MASEDLQLLGPHDAWHGAAHRGRLHHPDGSVEEVRVLLGPETTAVDAIDRALRGAEAALALRHEAVVPLIGLMPFSERIAWVYEAREGLGLVHTIGQGEDAMLSARAAAEVIGRTAEILCEVGPEAWNHPGPEPADLLLTAGGDLLLAGFSSPFPRTPVMRAPQGDEGEQALVYRLGVLFAQLVSGAIPTTASDRGAHASVIRRALIRSMSRPGPVLSERYGDWLRGLLAWDPAERPPLSSVPSGLRLVAEGTAGPDLRTWAAENVPALIARVELSAQKRRWGTEGALLGREHSGRGTPGDELDAAVLARRVAVPPSPTPAEQRALPPLPERDEDTMADEPTQEHPSSEPELIDSKPPIRVTSLLPMPVQVGPPPEAVRTRPSLPPGFLDDTTDPELPVSRLERTWLTPRALWAAGGMLGLVALLLLAINLALWGRTPPQTVTPPPRPSIADVLDPEGQATPSEGKPFRLTVQGPEATPLTVRCGAVYAEGVGRVVVEGVRAGNCEIRATVDEVEQSVEVDLVGPSTLVCTVAERLRCR